MCEFLIKNPKWCLQNLLIVWVWNGANVQKEWTSCRYKETQKNAPILAVGGFDTTENEPFAFVSNIRYTNTTYLKPRYLRNLEKAYAAVCWEDEVIGKEPFVTGQWGAGVFAMDPQLSFFLQSP